MLGINMIVFAYV